MNSPSLKQLLVSELPAGFFHNLYERIENIYPESYSAVFNNSLFGEEQANYVLGYYRRGLAETALRDTAVEFGLQSKVLNSINGGCKYVYINSKRFGFTMCHVQTPGGFPNPSDSREQSSKINEHITQQDLFPINDNPNDVKLYGIFVHSEAAGNKGIFNSLHLGFPNHTFDAWIDEPIDLLDVLDFQRRFPSNQEDPHSLIQMPEPKWKVHKKSKANEDK